MHRLQPAPSNSGGGLLALSCLFSATPPPRLSLIPICFACIMNLDKIYLWATSRCATKEYCRSELAPKMAAKGADAEEVEQLLERLERENYLNESRYAHAFVADKFRFDHWGRIKIRQALRLKGISESCTEEALREAVNEDDYRLALLDFIAAKRRSTKADSDYALKQKVARSALSRGFEPTLVFAALSMEEC